MDELQELARVDVEHEVRSLARWSSTKISPNEMQRPEPGFVEAANRALGECAMLHLRAVADFLENRARKGMPDLVAADYFKCRANWPAASLLTPKMRDDLNWHLAHLSRQRQTRREELDRFVWTTMRPVVADTLDTFKTFVAALIAHGHERQASWFTGAVAAIDNPWPEQLT